MASPEMDTHNSKETLCQTCGVTGYLELIDYCNNCQIATEHSYCHDKVDDENWVCEGCLPRFPRKPEVSLVSTRRSTRIKPRKRRPPKTIQNLKRQSCISLATIKGQSSNGLSTSECLKPFAEDMIPEPELNQNIINIDNDQGPELKKQKRLITCSSDVEAVHVESRKLDPIGSPVEKPPHHLSMEYQNFVQAQPIINQAWSGCFDIRNEKFGTIVGHLSSKACLKVFEGAKLLPPRLCVEVLPRLEAWPKSFQVAAPTDDNIALYFFPGNPSIERAFYVLLDDIMEQDLALKALIDNAELLIFSSRQFPQQYSRFNGKYYLWGVFRARKDSDPRKSVDVRNSFSKPITPISAMGIGRRNSSAKHLQIASPLSPLNTASSDQEWEPEN